jgi:molybdenum cofactor guanylyltransferase
VSPAAGPPSFPDPVGAILAGGASTRFGGPKGLARVAGERLLDRVARALRAAAPTLLLVANDPGAGAWLPGVPCVADARPGGGGLSGVHAALVHAGCPVLVAAWDMPFVSTPLLRALWRRCLESGADACYPESASPVGLEPFRACYAPSGLPALERALDSGNVGGARFAATLARVERLSATEVRAFGDPSRMLCNVNTPADLARAEALAAGTV